MNTGGTPISRKLTELREAKGVTQETVAALFGLSNRTVSKWEKGLSSPDLDYIPVLADYYGVSIDELFGREDHRKMDIGLAIRDSLRGCDAAQSIEKAFTLSNEIFAGCIRHFFDKTDASKDLDDYPVPGRVINENPIAKRNANYSNVGFHFIVNSAELNLAVLLPGNADNFRTMMERDAGYRPLFAFLAKPGAIRLLSAMFRKKFPVRCTADFAAQKTGLDREAASALLEEAVSCKVCKRSMAALRDGTVAVYDFIGNGMLLTILALAFEYASDTNEHYQRFRGAGKMIKGDL